MKLKDALRRLPTRSIRSGVICLGLLAALGIGQVASAVKASLSMTHDPPSSIEPWQDLVLTFSVSGDCEGDPPGASQDGIGIWVDKSCGSLSGGVSYEYDSGKGRTGGNWVNATFAPRDSQGLRAGTVTIPGSGLPSGATLYYSIWVQQSRSSVGTRVGYDGWTCEGRGCPLHRDGLPQPYVQGPTSNAISTAYTPEITRKISDAALSAPRNITAKTASGKAKGVALAWQAPASDGGSPIAGYRIYRGTASGGEAFLTGVGKVLSYKDSATVSGTVYFYRVSAVNAVAEGPQSNEAFAQAR